MSHRPHSLVDDVTSTTLGVGGGAGSRGRSRGPGLGAAARAGGADRYRTAFAEAGPVAPAAAGERGAAAVPRSAETWPSRTMTTRSAYVAPRASWVTTTTVASC